MTTTTLSRPPALPAPSPAPPAGRPRRTALLLGAALLVGVGAAGAVAVAVDQLGAPPPPATVAIGTSVPLDGIELTVTRFDRRLDAVMGVGTAQQPLSGPSMPMGSAMNAGSMVGMQGMAGMLEHGQERVDLSVVVRGTSGDATSVDPAQFHLYSGGRPVELLRPTDTTLSDTGLRRGTGMRGGVVMVLPEGTRPLELAYGDGPTRWVLDAGTPAGAPSGPDTAAPGHSGSTHQGGDR